MSRKRPSNHTPSTPAPPEVIPAATPAVPAEPPASAGGPPQATIDDKPGFADKMEQRKFVPAPDPFGIASDHLAGVRLFESKQDRQVAIQFEEKPSPAVINTMKQAGYRWNPEDRIWAHPVWPDSARSTRIDAERLYQEVCRTIRQEKGISVEQEVPF